MKEKVKAYWEKATGLLKKVSKKVYIALAALVVVAAGLVIWLNSRPYEVLFTELSTTDLSYIASYVESVGVTDYKIENNDTILVPPGQEDALRAALLLEGYPKSGFSYVVTETSALSTQAERNQAALNDLQASMSETIKAFSNVVDAIVYINPGEDRSYVLDSNNVVEASATVMVEMKPDQQLSDDQAAAIRRLVAFAVAGLDINNVTIEDTMGTRYSDSESMATGDASALKLMLEEQYENKIRSEVLKALTPFFGSDNVKISVNCTVDIDQTVTESTDYFLPEYAVDGSTYGRGIVGSRVFSYVYDRDNEETVGGVVGTDTNADISEYVEDYPFLNGSETSIDISGQEDYLTSNSKKQIVQTAGYLTDCTISVSINSRVTGSVDLSSFPQHIARAAGIEGTYDENGVEQLGQYISIVSAPFYEPQDETPSTTEPGGSILIGELEIPLWILIAAGVGILLFFLIILILILRRRKKKRLQAELEAQQALEEEQAAMEAVDVQAFLAAAAANAEAPQNGADVMGIQSERSVELRQNLRKFVEDNPEIAAQMLKVWLRGDDENG